MKHFISILSLLIPILLKAQPFSEPLIDSVIIRELTTEKKETSLLTKSAPYTVPAAMFGFGILANHHDGLKHINRQIRDEVLEKERPINPKTEDFLQYVPAYSVFALNAIGLKSEHKLIDRLFLYGLSNTIMSHTVSKIKSMSNQLRPNGMDRRSFPSGHTATAFSAAEFMRLEYKDQSPVYGIAAYTIAAATGTLRIYHNNHWFSDVIAGAGIGILSTDLAYFVYPKVKKFISKHTGFRNENLHIGPSYQYGQAGFSLIYNPQ